MKINLKVSVTAGLVLFTAAAFLCISLMTVFFGAQGVPALLGNPGLFFASAYGYSSWLIVVFLLAAGITVMLPEWTGRRALYLSVSVLPFFTLALAEKLCVFITGGVNVPYLVLKLGAVVVAAILLVAIEYLFAGFVYDMFSLAQKPEPESKPFADFEDSLEQDFAPVYEKTPEAADLNAGSVEEIPAVQRVENAFLGQPPQVGGFEAAGEQEARPVAVEVLPHVFESEGFLDKTSLDKMSFSEEAIAEVAEEEVAASESFAAPPLPETDDLPEFVPCAEDEEKVLFVDLNWKQNHTLPVRLTDTEEKADEDFFGESEAEAYGDTFGAFDEEMGRDFDADFESEVEDEEKLLGEPFAETSESFAEDENFDEGFEESENFAADFEDVPAVPVFSTPAVIPPRPAALKRGSYRVPADGLLNSYPDGEYWIIDSETQRAASILKETLSEFKISAEVTGIRKGPVITMFEILPAPGVKLTRIVALQDNIALRLAASSVRIVAPIPGKHAVGIEVPNKDRFIVSFRELIDNDAVGFKKMEIPVVLGKDITGEAKILDLASTPHLLIAGSTGSGKSVCVNSMILSILYKRAPQEVKMILIDPKIVELKLYNDIPHLLTPVITEPKKAFQALQYCLCEMERRYSMLDKMGVRDIKSYNRRITERNLANEKLAYIVVIIDEFADLMATTGKELESTVARLAAMSRAVGVHLVLATQRPSIDVITGLIKANIPTRIAFMVASKMDSRIIIDQVGAEKLLGRGDMLYSSAVDPFPVRIQGTYVSEEEVERVVEFVKQYGEPEYIDDEIFFDEEEENSEPSLFGGENDPLYDKALEIVLQAGKASASYIQRRLKIGYNRAARLVEDMEQRGIVGPANGSKPREVVHVPR